MTPAINSAKKANICYQIHQYDHDPANKSYGDEAAAKLKINNRRIFKTLVVELNHKTLAVAVVPVATLLNLKTLSLIFGVKKIKMANPGDVQKSTGYVTGGVSPLGQKKRLKTIMDESAKKFETIYVSAGKRGVQIELSPQDLADLTGAEFSPITQPR